MITHVRCYHRYYRTRWHLWQERFKCFGIDDDDYFLAVARYVEENPVRAVLKEAGLS